MNNEKQILSVQEGKSSCRCQCSSSQRQFLYSLKNRRTAFRKSWPPKTRLSSWTDKSVIIICIISGLSSTSFCKKCFSNFNSSSLPSSFSSLLYQISGRSGWDPFSFNPTNLFVISHCLQAHEKIRKIHTCTRTQRYTEQAHKCMCKYTKNTIHTYKTRTHTSCIHRVTWTSKHYHTLFKQKYTQTHSHTGAYTHEHNQWRRCFPFFRFYFKSPDFNGPTGLAAVFYAFFLHSIRSAFIAFIYLLVCVHGVLCAFLAAFLT